MRPQDAGSPRVRIVEGPDVLYQDRDGGWSVAKLIWRHAPEDIGGGPEVRERIGIRWDGKQGKPGQPQARGYGMWFLLPEGEISDFVKSHAEKLGANDAHQT